MAEKTEKAEKPKTYAEAKHAYDVLAKQCTELVAGMPKIRVEIERQVKAKMGDAEKQLADIKAKKAAAALEMYAAEAREQPEREAKAVADAEAKAQKELAAKAKANADRIADQAKSLASRAADATK